MNFFCIFSSYSFSISSPVQFLRFLLLCFFVFFFFGSFFYSPFFSFFCCILHFLFILLLRSRPSESQNYMIMYCKVHSVFAIKKDESDVNSNTALLLCCFSLNL
jgi:hypothetical protein